MELKGPRVDWVLHWCMYRESHDEQNGISVNLDVSRQLNRISAKQGIHPHMDTKNPGQPHDEGYRQDLDIVILGQDDS